MKPIAIIYAKNTAKTTLVAQYIKEAMGNNPATLVPIEDAWQEEFETYDNIIAGVSTWFDGELPAYWDEVIPIIETLDLSNKKVAIFGLGDQVNYPDNFVDGIGLLADVFEKVGAKIIGITDTKGFEFNNSKGLRDGKFLGLPIDIENQPDEIEKRVNHWVEQLKKEFK